MVGVAQADQESAYRFIFTLKYYCLNFIGS